MLELFVIGYIYYGIYVIWFIKAVPKTHEAKRKETSTPSLETMVHTNPLRSQVTIRSTT